MLLHASQPFAAKPVLPGKKRQNIEFATHIASSTPYQTGADTEKRHLGFITQVAGRFSVPRQFVKETASDKQQLILHYGWRTIKQPQINKTIFKQFGIKKQVINQFENNPLTKPVPHYHPMLQTIIKYLRRSVPANIKQYSSLFADIFDNKTAKNNTSKNNTPKNITSNNKTLKNEAVYNLLAKNTATNRFTPPLTETGNLDFNHFKPRHLKQMQLKTPHMPGLSNLMPYGNASLWNVNGYGNGKDNGKDNHYNVYPGTRTFSKQRSNLSFNRHQPRNSNSERSFHFQDIIGAEFPFSRLLSTQFSTPGQLNPHRVKQESDQASNTNPQHLSYLHNIDLSRFKPLAGLNLPKQLLKVLQGTSKYSEVSPTLNNSITHQSGANEKSGVLLKRSKSLLNALTQSVTAYFTGQPVASTTTSNTTKLEPQTPASKLPLFTGPLVLNTWDSRQQLNASFPSERALQLNPSLSSQDVYSRQEQYARQGMGLMELNHYKKEYQNIRQSLPYKLADSIPVAMPLAATQTVQATDPKNKTQFLPSYSTILEHFNGQSGIGMLSNALLTPGTFKNINNSALFTSHHPQLQLVVSNTATNHQSPVNKNLKRGSILNKLRLSDTLPTTVKTANLDTTQDLVYSQNKMNNQAPTTMSPVPPNLVTPETHSTSQHSIPAVPGTPPIKQLTPMEPNYKPDPSAITKALSSAQTRQLADEVYDMINKRLRFEKRRRGLS